MTNRSTSSDAPRPRRGEVLGERPPWHVAAGNLLELALVFLGPWWVLLAVGRLVAADLAALAPP